MHMSATSNSNPYTVGVLSPVHIIQVLLSSVWCTDGHLGSVQFSSRHFIETKIMILDIKNTTLCSFISEPAAAGSI